MHPYIPFAALPAAVLVAWFAAPYFSTSDPVRYRVPPVAQIEDPSALMEARAQAVEKPDIRVQAFLPHKPPRVPDPEPILVLQSVVTGDQVRLATINGRNVQEGDRVEGYVVQRITADGVVLVDGDRSRRLPMRPLHELPPPIQPDEDSSQTHPGARRESTDLTQDFWRIFDALKP
ncbi:MAG: general secretion pathway protein GspB [Candidatus Sedimenticola sp. (ex Thyasira tokunagai)]